MNVTCGKPNIGNMSFSSQADRSRVIAERFARCDSAAADWCWFRQTQLAERCDTLWRHQSVGVRFVQVFVLRVRVPADSLWALICSSSSSCCLLKMKPAAAKSSTTTSSIHFRSDEQARWQGPILSFFCQLLTSLYLAPWYAAACNPGRLLSWLNPFPAYLIRLAKHGSVLAHARHDSMAWRSIFIYFLFYTTISVKKLQVDEFQLMMLTLCKPRVRLLLALRQVCCRCRWSWKKVIEFAASNQLVAWPLFKIRARNYFNY